MACLKDLGSVLASLWPKADFPVAFHPGATASLASIPLPLDSGALRVGESGCIEILRIGGSDPGYYWVNYDPDDYTLWLDANKFWRYGRGHSHGHGHGRDDIAAIAYTIWPVLFGKKATLIDELDTYHRTLGGRNWWVYSLIKEYEKLTATPEPDIPPVEPPKPEEPPITQPEPEDPPDGILEQKIDELQKIIEGLEDELDTIKAEAEERELEFDDILEKETAWLIDTIEDLREELATKPVLPGEHKDTLNEIFQWTVLGPGRYARIRRLKNYIYQYFQ